jgi:hypothetical protein
MKITFKLPSPIHDVQQKMLDFILDEEPTCRECYVAVGTKGGKSLISSVGAVSLMYSSDQAHLRWTAPRYNQSKIGMNYIKKFVPLDHPNRKVRNLFRLTESDTPKIASLSNDTYIEFLHALNPSAIEGFATKCNFLDEIAKYKRLEEFINSVRTTTTMTRGKIIGFSTPLSKGNYFYSLWQGAKDEMEWCIKNGKKPTKLAFTSPTTANPLISPVVIEEMRKNMPERLFRQYVLAEFTDDGTVFSAIMSCVEGEKLEVNGRFEEWYIEELLDKASVMSIDWGKTGDFTVVTVWTYVGDRMWLSGFMRFRKISYTEAILIHIYKFYKKFDNISILIHDATGVGGGLVDTLEGRYTDSTVISNVFTNQKKTEMVNMAIVAFEKKKARLPFWSTLIAEATSFEVKVNAIGTIVYSAPEGEHDDCVCSMVQGMWALESEFGDYSAGFTIDTFEGRLDYHSGEMVVGDTRDNLTYEDMRNLNIECQLGNIPIPYPDIPDPLREQHY